MEAVLLTGWQLWFSRREREQRGAPLSSAVPLPLLPGLAFLDARESICSAITARTYLGNRPSRLDPKSTKSTKSIYAEGCRLKTETSGKFDTIPAFSPDSSVL